MHVSCLTCHSVFLFDCFVVVFFAFKSRDIWITTTYRKMTDVLLAYLDIRVFPHRSGIPVRSWPAPDPRTGKYRRR